MKKLIAVATAVSGALALAACGGGSDEPSEADIDEDVAEAVMPADSTGTYTGTTADGEEAVTVLAADGNYTITVAGEEVETGTWEDNIRGTCLTAEGGEGEECYNIQPGDEEGIKDVTGPDGETTSWSFEA